MGNRDHHIRIIEALLFAAAEPLSTKDLHARMEASGQAGADVGAALMGLKKDYDGRGISLVELDGKWAFRTAKDLADDLTLETVQTKKLSRAAMETLAIIAYHQPVTRAEIENIRGVVTHRGTLDVLIEAGWVKPGRRRETPGRPLTWVSTSAFLDQFSLESIVDLPGLDDLKASGLLDRRPAIQAIPTSDDLFAEQEAAEEEAAGQEEAIGVETDIEDFASNDDQVDAPQDDKHADDQSEAFEEILEEL